MILRTAPCVQRGFDRAARVARRYDNPTGTWGRAWFAFRWGRDLHRAVGWRIDDPIWPNAAVPRLPPGHPANPMVPMLPMVLKS
jgi:hypothetical protein